MPNVAPVHWLGEPIPLKMVRSELKTLGRAEIGDERIGQLLARAAIVVSRSRSPTRVRSSARNSILTGEWLMLLRDLFLKLRLLIVYDLPPEECRFKTIRKEDLRAPSCPSRDVSSGKRADSFGISYMNLRGRLESSAECF